MIEYYLGTLQECQEIDEIISANCGWSDGNTHHWASPVETLNVGVFSIPVPQGSHGLTKEQMNDGIAKEIVTGVEFSEELSG